MRLIIAGGRDFTDYSKCKYVLDHLLQDIPKNTGDIIVLCGEAKGADTLGEQYAQQYLDGVEYYPAEWELHGKAAGYIRNKQMAEAATHLVAFWDGKSKGTKHMIDLAEKHNLNIRVVRY
jgi:hypothetical protein